MLNKTLSIDVKDVDAKNDIVQFYFAVFGDETSMPDTDGDIIIKGAFAKTIKENFKRIKHFKNHWRDELVGVPKEIIEDDFGGLMTSQLILGTQKGKEAFEEYKAGGITEHSFGYDIIQAEPITRDEVTVQLLKELRLREASTLTAWGANEFTRVVDVKGEKGLLDYLDTLMKLKKGDFSDEYFMKLETRIYEVNKYIKTLTEPLTRKEPGTQFEPLKYFRDNFNLIN